MRPALLRLTLVALSLGLTGGAFIMQATSPALILPVREATLPERIGSFELRQSQELEPDVLEMLAPAAYRMLRYDKDDGSSAVWLYLAYYGGAGAKGAHEPSVCYPAQGWDVVRARQIEVPLAGEEVLVANLLRARLPGREESVLSWFQPAGRWPARTGLEEFLRPYDALRLRPQYAFVRLSMAHKKGAPKPKEALIEFARAMAPAIRNSLEPNTALATVSAPPAR